MSIHEYIKAMPKVELNIQLTGALKLESLLMIVEQNDTRGSVKRFNDWLSLLENPDYERVDEIAEVTGKWLKYPEDIARVVYDLGVSLSKQNVRYAEVMVTPSLFLDNDDMTIETFIDALNDGRDKVLRGWNVRLAWIFAIARDNPRSGDDVARWVTSAAGRKGYVVGLGLSGREDSQPQGQFRRPFQTAMKKDILTVAHAGSLLGLESINATLTDLEPSRLTDTWGLLEDAETLNRLIETDTPVVASMTRALRLNQVASYGEYPLQQLIDADLKVILSSGMPSLYGNSITDELIAAHEECHLGLDEIEEMMLNGIHYSFLDDEEKQVMTEAFKADFNRLRESQVIEN